VPSAFAPVPRSSAAPVPSPFDRPADPLELPPPWNPPSRPTVPLLASVVPILGAVALWLVTGSVLSLWLAALGPLIAGATLLDAARGARRDRRRAERTARAARERVGQQIAQRHAEELRRLWARHPDVAAFAAHHSEIWRPVPARAHLLVVGSGVDSSELRVHGGGDDAASADIRARAARLEGAPITVDPTSGIAVTGGAVLAAAVVRSLVAQLAMILPPGALRIVGPLRGENAWAEKLPHRRAGSGLRLAVLSPGDPVVDDADIRIVRADRAAPRPPGYAVVLTVQGLAQGEIDAGGELREIAVEAIGHPQAVALAHELASRATGLLATDVSPDPVALAPLLVRAPGASPGSLSAVIGTAADEPCVIDLVADGPHAVVAGVTGSGKSELLVTWILALCAAHSTREVSFLLADFKGGTAFDALAGMPHVTGVLTDLDGSGARRAIESLRAEVRWRETELARVGARDLRDPRVDVPRLVIVVDEFAALLGEHPELHAVFTDVAARGRALGMHLILGTQRPSGVVRESLLANCPLRISLRVTDPADSRAVIGTDEAAMLSGGLHARGLALVRTAGDRAPRRVRIALSSASDCEAITAAADGARPRRPWLPDLPARIDLEDLAALAGAADATLLIGLADEPERQRQQPVGVRLQERGMLVVGSGGSGKSTVLSLLEAQTAGAVVRVGGSGEQAWDAVAGLTERIPDPGTLVLIDDLDALTSALPPDYARELLERLDLSIRGAGDAGIFVVVAAQRLSGGVARIAELLPRRLVLAASSRAEHIAAGADPAHYVPGSPPGRGRLDGRSVQVAMMSPTPSVRPSAPLPWHPRGPLSGFVMRHSPRARTALAGWEAEGARVLSLEEFAGGGEWATGAPVVIAGETDEWQRHWRTLSAVRSDHDLVVDASCGSELRLLTGERGLPPYCEPGRARAWLFTAGGAARRISLPVGP
jgi:S-DNA-T family DNA segregation ATPase FtsK/SpoIIIE